MSKEEMIKEIAESIFDTVYDPWTEDVTIEGIIQDINNDPIEVMYAMAHHIKDLYDTINES